MNRLLNSRDKGPAHASTGLNNKNMSDVQGYNTTNIATQGRWLGIDKKRSSDSLCSLCSSKETFLKNPSYGDKDVPVSKQVMGNEQNDRLSIISKKSSENCDRLLSSTNHGRNINEDQFSKYKVKNNDYKTKEEPSKRDGRLNISVNKTNNHGYLAKALGVPSSSHVKDSFSTDDIGDGENSMNYSRNSFKVTSTLETSPPILNILVMVIGSRGDIQPFLKLGKKLKDYGHRVRIATHPAFKNFVKDYSDLDFFSIGGDPAELMEFMVKNPGVIPTMETLKKGEVGRRREQMAEMFEGFWRACINASDDEKDHENFKMMNARSPFVADAIIANPPSFAHIHCAERLGIPLHLMFTFPYTPTQEFPHPLANVKQTNEDPSYTNFISYPMVEMMTWQGLGDLINKFRVKTLGLEPVSTLWAPGQLYRLKVSHTYLWSPTLVPKPHDWGHEIKITGFVYLDLAPSFEPPKDLLEFLDKHPPPIYVGFGSIVVEDSEGFTNMIFDAVRRSNVRALVSKGWSDLGGCHLPDNIFLLENIPHDWIFPRVSAVVHHGGAGTTAAGIKFGKPTMIIPFFGDQHFWGNMINKSGAGPPPVPYKNLTVEILADGIKSCLSDETRDSAQKIAESIEAEGDGAANAMASFHRSLVLKGKYSMRCSILEDRVAVWNIKKKNVRLCALAAEILMKEKKINPKQLKLIRHNEWNDFEGPGEPITGGASALLGTATGITAGIGSVPYQIGKKTKKRVDHEKSKTKNSQIICYKGKKGHKNQAVGGNNQDCKCDNAADSTTSIKTTTTQLCATKNILNHQNYIAGRLSNDPEETAIEEAAHVIRSGFGRTGKTILKAPMDLSLAVAQGLHNAPRLYGDETVRQPIRITGFKSGLRAAGKEFIYGIYDGVTGLVVQPCSGARNHGAVGAIKGVGMGLTGFILKDLSAIIGPLGYALKGIHKEFSRHKQPTNFIRRARIIEGEQEFKCLSNDESLKNLSTVCNGWSLFEEIWSLAQEKRNMGFRAKFHSMQEWKNLKVTSSFENLIEAQKVLKALKNEHGFDHSPILPEDVSNYEQNLREKDHTCRQKGAQNL